MTNPNTKKQSEAVDKIHKIAEDANMCVFMLVDEDIEMYDDDASLTQDEKHDLWERMHEALLDHYGEMFATCIEEIKSERE
jgi:hypothetical protein